MNEMWNVKSVLEVWSNPYGKDFVICEYEVLASSHTKDLICVKNNVTQQTFFVTKRKNNRWIFEGHNIKSEKHFIAKPE